VPADRPQPHDERDGVHHRGVVRVPNANGHTPFECAAVAEVLGECGWDSYMVGKWQLCAEDEEDLFRSGGSGRSDVALSASTCFGRGDEPVVSRDLVYDNDLLEQPTTPEAGYHLSVDITDQEGRHAAVFIDPISLLFARGEVVPAAIRARDELRALVRPPATTTVLTLRISHIGRCFAANIRVRWRESRRTRAAGRVPARPTSRGDPHGI
jgi:hypothetical protein